MTASLHVEHQILAVCLTTPGAIREVASIIHVPDTFSTIQNQQVYGVMLELNAQSYETDLISVNNDLQTKYGLLRGEPTGWIEFLTSLFPEVDTMTGNLAKSCYFLIAEATRRTLMKIYSRALSELQIPGSDPLTLMGEVREKMESIENRLSELSETPFADSYVEAVKLAQQAAESKDPITGTKTLISGLDMYLKGLHGSTLTILAARPAQGKTAELCQIAYNISHVQKIPVAIFELEMKNLQLARRNLAIDSGIKNSEVLSGLNRYNEPVDMNRLMASAGLLSSDPLFVYDKIFSLDHIIAKTRQLAISQGVKVVFIDYLQLVETNDRDDRVRVSRVSRKLKNLANELDVAIVALSQLSRKVEERTDKRPKLSDLRESGSIEQDADNVVFLFCPSTYSERDEDGRIWDKNLLYNIIAKNRNGSTHNDKEGIELHYEKATNQIKDYSQWG